MDLTKSHERLNPTFVRILHTTHSAHPGTGGPIEGIRQLSNGLRTLGHEAELATLDNPQSTVGGEFSIPVHCLGPGMPGYGYSRRFRSWVQAEAHRFDAVVVHGLWLYNGLGTRRGLRGTGIPWLVYPHGMLDAWFRRTYPVRHLKKLAYWWVAERKLLNDAAAVLFTTSEERERGSATFPGFRGRTRVVGFGTSGPPDELTPSVAEEAFRRRFSAIDGDPFILFLGRLHEKKGLDLLLQAYAGWSGRDRVSLVIAGSAADAGGERHWRSEAERHGLDPDSQVLFTGHIEGSEKWGAFFAAEAFILPSHQENFGVAVAEALACGCPVLISQEVNIWREIADDGAGLVAPDNLAGTADLLERWATTGPGERRRMAANARQCFADRFSAISAARNLAQAVEAAVAGGR